MNKFRIFVSILLTIICVSITYKASAKQFRALLFTKTAGWHHSSIHEGVTAMRRLSKIHHFDLDWHEDSNQFNRDNLSKYDVVIFMLTTGDVLSDEQQMVFEEYISQGNGFVGIHSAADTEYGWSWYQGLVGRTFVIHPPIQTARINVIDHNFPGLEFFPKQFFWTDEYYNFSEEISPSLNYLLTVDESTYSAEAQWGNVKSEGMGKFHPVSWYQEYDGGRSFYTALGHIPDSYSQQNFLTHLYGGIYWAATGNGILLN